jgi:competence protein ComEC
MLFANPYCVSSVGLQLSAGCMCGIFLFSGKIQEWFLDSCRLGRFRGKAKKFAAWFASCVAVTLSATLVTTPLCAFYFGTVSLISPLTNLLTLWVVTFIFYGIGLGCILALIWLPMGRVLGWIVSWPIRYVLQISKLAAGFPMSAVYTASIYIVIFLVFAYILLAVFMFMKRKRPVMLTCCLVICLCICLGASWIEPLCDDVRMTILDVGQGQSILLQSEGKTFLVDCGGDSDTAAADAAAEKLLSMGISRLDGLILTHYDRDHAGGAAYLLSRVRADALYLPHCIDTDGYSEPLQQMPQAVMVDDHMQIRFGAVTIKLITTDYGISNNESGLCVLFQRENCDILITGDRNIYGEKDLLRQIDLPDLEVLVVGHHGSKYSTSVELLEAGKPDIAIISVGENSYGHPTNEVLDRLTEFGCEVYRTDQQGTITFRR